MKSIKLHQMMLIFTLWMLIASSFVAPFLGDLFGAEGMYYQLVLIPSFFLPLCILYPLLKRNAPVKPYPLKPLSRHDLTWTMVFTVSFLAIFVFLNLLPGTPMRALQSFRGYPIWLPILAVGIMSALEVLFYQGVLYSDYRSRNTSIWHTAIIIGIFATLLHMHPPQFMILLAMQRVISTFMIHWTKSIWPAILMNTLIFTGIIVVIFGFTSAENQTTLLIVFGALSLIAAASTLFGLKQMKANDKTSYTNDDTEVPQKPPVSPFNWVFWVLAAAWMALYIFQFLTLTIRI